MFPEFVLYIFLQPPTFKTLKKRFKKISKRISILKVMCSLKYSISASDQGSKTSMRLLIYIFHSFIGVLTGLGSLGDT